MHDKEQSLLGAKTGYHDAQNGGQPLIKHGIYLREDRFKHDATFDDCE